MKTVTMTLPYPISANRYWATRAYKAKATGKWMAMTYTTTEAAEYKQEVAKIARRSGFTTPHDGRFTVEIKLYPQRPQDWAKRSQKDPECWDDDVRCMDLGNCEKVIGDALNGVVWVDDKQIRRLVKDRMQPDGEARVVITITLVPRETPELFKAPELDLSSASARN